MNKYDTADLRAENVDINKIRQNNFFSSLEQLINTEQSKKRKKPNDLPLLVQFGKGFGKTHASMKYLSDHQDEFSHIVFKDSGKFEIINYSLDNSTKKFITTRNDLEDISDISNLDTNAIIFDDIHYLFEANLNGAISSEEIRRYLAESFNSQDRRETILISDSFLTNYIGTHAAINHFGKELYEDITKLDKKCRIVDESDFERISHIAQNRDSFIADDLLETSVENKFRKSRDAGLIEGISHIKEKTYEGLIRINELNKEIEQCNDNKDRSKLRDKLSAFKNQFIDELKEYQLETYEKHRRKHFQKVTPISGYFNIPGIDGLMMKQEIDSSGCEEESYLFSRHRADNTIQTNARISKFPGIRDKFMNISNDIINIANSDKIYNLLPIETIFNYSPFEVSEKIELDESFLKNDFFTSMRSFSTSSNFRELKRLKNKIGNKTLETVLYESLIDPSMSTELETLLERVFLSSFSELIGPIREKYEHDSSIMEGKEIKRVEDRFKVFDNGPKRDYHKIRMCNDEIAKIKQQFSSEKKREIKEIKNIVRDRLDFILDKTLYEIENLIPVTEKSIGQIGKFIFDDISQDRFLFDLITLSTKEPSYTSSIFEISERIPLLADS